MSNHEPASRGRRRALGMVATLVPPLVVFLAACSSSDGGKASCASNPPNQDGGIPGVDGGPKPITETEGGRRSGDAGHRPTVDGGTSGADGGQPNTGVSFRPSNLPSGALDLGDAGVAGDVVINDDCVVNTSSGDLYCPATIDKFDFVFKMVDEPGGGQAGLFIVKSLRVAQAAQLEVVGGSPAIVYALDTVKIDGIVTGVATGQPAGGFEQDDTGHGGGPGGGEALLDYNAAGGGSYCGIGGKGGPGSGGPARAGGTVYGNPEIAPLIGGSSGGGGANLSTSGGTGGAALELGAGRSITVSLGGTVNVGGLGGHANGGGAGSGGALILEAPAVTVRGTLAANGGGGALFNGGSSGQPGQPSSTAAQGSASTAGIGSAGKTANGGDGTTDGSSVNSAGGGGGGAGRIRINTASGSADLTGATISPDPSTGCATQGKLAS